MGARHKFKRAIDFSGALLGLILISPIILLLGFLVRMFMGAPVIFRQARPGLKGTPFEMYKFRTMRDLRDESGELLPDSERLVPFGNFLRHTSLDELPELVNVLKGEMSLVGPRPLLIDYLDRYTSEQARRHEMRPGMTGLAQINGRQTISFAKRLGLDVWYVDNWSLSLDFKILLKTIPSVFLSRGVVLGQEVNEVDDLGLSGRSKL